MNVTDELFASESALAVRAIEYDASPTPLNTAGLLLAAKRYAAARRARTAANGITMRAADEVQAEVLRAEGALRAAGPIREG